MGQNYHFWDKKCDFSLLCEVKAIKMSVNKYDYGKFVRYICEEWYLGRKHSK